jgi:hypothetical protein
MTESRSQDSLPPGSREGAFDVARLDRVLSRSLFLIGAIGLVGLWATHSSPSLRRPAWVVAAAIYAAGKLVVLAVGLKQHWPAWPAVLAEALAVAMVAAIVWTGTHEVIYVVVVAALLLASGLWRGRTAQASEEDV